MTKKIIKVALILVGTALLPSLISNASAQYLTQTNQQVGDLILGFENTGGGGTKDLVIDLGSVTNSAFLAGINLNLYSDLTNTFGTGFSNTVSYGLFSATGNNNLYASGSTNMGAVGYPVESHSSQGVQEGYFASFLTTLNSDGSSQATTHGVYQLVSESESWTTAGTPYNGAFQDSDYPNIDSAIGSTSTLYYQHYAAPGPFGVSDNLNFNVSTAGVLTVSAVPEPGTYALFGLGVLLLIVAYRRRANA